MNRILIQEYDEHGRISEPLNSINTLIRDGFQQTAEDVQGDGNVNGTAILTKEVPAGQVLSVVNLGIHSKVSQTTIKVVESDTNGVGGVETAIATLDTNGFAQAIQGGVPLFINNSGGTASKYLVVYAPQSRAGAATNNANTEYWACNLTGIVR